jgi:hypothetical protein
MPSDQAEPMCEVMAEGALVQQWQTKPQRSSSEEERKQGSEGHTEEDEPEPDLMLASAARVKSATQASALFALQERKRAELFDAVSLTKREHDSMQRTLALSTCSQFLQNGGGAGGNVIRNHGSSSSSSSSSSSNRSKRKSGGSRAAAAQPAGAAAGSPANGGASSTIWACATSDGGAEGDSGQADGLEIFDNLFDSLSVDNTSNGSPGGGMVGLALAAMKEERENAGSAAAAPVAAPASFSTLAGVALPGADSAGGFLPRVAAGALPSGDEPVAGRGVEPGAAAAVGATGGARGGTGRRQRRSAAMGCRQESGAVELGHKVKVKREPCSS